MKNSVTHTNISKERRSLWLLQGLCNTKFKLNSSLCKINSVDKCSTIEICFNLPHYKLQISLGKIIHILQMMKYQAMG